MILEAIANKDQKQKQRQKEYEKKRDQKARDRQLYHLRHARDYEALGVPMGSSKADVKKAYREVGRSSRLQFRLSFLHICFVSMLS
jgi:pyruvate/2-oxoacid:ferredoxin oxidoreductase alpha subunit